MIKRTDKLYGFRQIVVGLSCFLFGISVADPEERLFQDVEDYYTAVDQAKTKLKENLSGMERVMEQNPNDAVVHRGVAELYAFLGYKYRERAITIYRKALIIEPMTEELQVGLIIPHISYYRSIDDKDKKEVILSGLMEESQKGEEQWPGNAFYNYVKAYVYLERAEKDKVRMEIEKALGKPYMRVYQKSMTRARDRVLVLLSFPRRLKIPLNMTYTRTFAVPIESCVSYLSACAEDLQKESKFKDAIQLYNDCIKMVRHLEEDSFHEPLIEQVYLLNIYSAIRECYEKQGLQAYAEEIRREMEKVKAKKEMLRERLGREENFSVTADAEEVEKEYQRMLEQGWSEK